MDRRALRTLRPPRVAIRARKPCVRLRLRLLGWKVLFITPCSTASWAVYRTGDASARRERDFREASPTSQIIKGVFTEKDGCWLLRGRMAVDIPGNPTEFACPRRGITCGKSFGTPITTCGRIARPGPVPGLLAIIHRFSKFLPTADPCTGSSNRNALLHLTV